MRTVSITWDQGAGRFTAVGSHPGQQISVNAPRDESEPRAPTGFSATELLLAAAGSCSAWDVVEILRKRRESVHSLDVSVEGDQSPDPPWEYTRVALHYRIQCERLTYGVIARVVRLSIVRYCSVINTIAGVADIEATVEIVAMDGTSNGRKHIELALPSQPGAESGFTALDLAAVGVAEPIFDKDEE